jgi:ATP-dependent DNA helicase
VSLSLRFVILCTDARVLSAVKQVNNMKLQNTVMQLRKVCSHPFLFDWPLDPRTHQPILNEDLVNASGKMMVLDRLLTELFRRKHKVLLFSQFTTMLDIIEVGRLTRLF